MNKKIKLVVCCLALAAMSACGKKTLPTVGVIQYASHPALDLAYDGFVKALEEEGFIENETVIIDYKNAQNDATMTETIANSLVNNQSSLIYAIATPAAQAVAQKTSDIPIVVSAVTDPAAVGLVQTNDKPNTNVTGMSDLTPVDEQIDLLTQLLPEAKKVAILYSNSEENSRIQADVAKKSLESRGIEWEESKVSDLSQIKQVTQSLAGKVDAIYIPTDSLMAEGVSTISDVASENGLPCIVGERALVVEGGLATYGIDYFRLGFEAGKQAATILKGEGNPQDMPVSYLALKDFELVINEKTAKELGVKIPSELLEAAEIISE